MTSMNKNAALQACILMLGSLVFANANAIEAQAEDSKTSQVKTAIAEANLVMTEFMASFNARDAARWADTLLFPHIRVASGSVNISPTRDKFVEEMDFAAFAKSNGWHHSGWESIEVIQAAVDKIHFKVRFNRYNEAGEPYASFDSLYVLQRSENWWGIRLRSSFAP